MPKGALDSETVSITRLINSLDNVNDALPFWRSAFRRRRTNAPCYPRMSSPFRLFIAPCYPRTSGACRLLEDGRSLSRVNFCHPSQRAHTHLKASSRGQSSSSFDGRGKTVLKANDEVRAFPSHRLRKKCTAQLSHDDAEHIDCHVNSTCPFVQEPPLQEWTRYHRLRGCKAFHDQSCI